MQKKSSKKRFCTILLFFWTIVLFDYSFFSLLCTANLLREIIKKGLYRFCPWIAHAKTVSQISPSNGTLFNNKSVTLHHDKKVLVLLFCISLNLHYLCTNFKKEI